MTEGWLRCRERYRCDRRVTTGTLQQKMGSIAPYTQRYSAPQRLHPPVSFADSPPWQGGPRGLSNPANKAKAAHESAKRHYPHKIQCSTTKHKNSCRRQHPATTWRVLCDDRWLLHESPGVQGGAPPWCFSPGFSRKAGPWPGRPLPVGRQPYTWCVTVGVQAVRIVRPHPPSKDR